MGEIDTKSIEPVQVALSFFGESGDQGKHKPPMSDSENEKEKSVEGLMKDLANCKLQLEAKDFAYKQVLLKLEHYEKISEELSTLLKQSENERGKNIEQFTGAKYYIDELESKVKEMADQLSETAMIREQILHVLNELKAAQEELIRMETELASARDLQFKAITEAELMESAASMEKEKAEELLRRVVELNEALLMSQLAEEEKCNFLSEKEAEIELANVNAAQAQMQLEGLKKQLEITQEMESELLAKSIFVDVLQLELKQSAELLSSSDRATSDAIEVLKQLKEDMEVKVRENADQALHIEALEMELSLLKLELKNSNEEIGCLKSSVETLTDELQRAKTEMNEVKARENDAQVEIAMLKSELHKGRSKIAAAEAAEARAENIKSGLYLAVQELAVKAEKAKKQNQKPKEGADEAVEESESVFVNTQAEEGRSENDVHITISYEEYEFLKKNAKMENQIPMSLVENSYDFEGNDEVEMVKKELEVAMMKIGEFRNRLEQAVTRAEAAEKAKLALEDQLRKWREQRQKRKAAFAALREDSTPQVQNFPTYEKLPAIYQPLGKVLNMKF
ncbi:protein WEAK CHLOROPLAST MOVEMENT UNDER BLUE LIGHT 1-like [Pistacia vera]|uniref:protein WEAK CHLOROPLAST MOVEMENT UNDER BLUE LIGHT 1-like n=1 Tax=Pistacia vera TaxID=55513 RepID=UPI0012635B01|nr:protein WEAK CHLOROPLAST MOVEMENT UNDER BLUE LIGHT 1-like [Pistacia vera]